MELQQCTNLAKASGSADEYARVKSGCRHASATHVRLRPGTLMFLPGVIE